MSVEQVRKALARSPARSPASRGTSRTAADGRGGRPLRSRPAATCRRGRHRHRQDARLPRARRDRRQARRSSPPPPRPCRTSWPARTCRSSRSTSDAAVRLGGAEGSQQLRVPPAAARAVAGGRRPARAGGDGHHHEGRDQAARRPGRAPPAPATWPSSTGRRPTRAWRAVTVSSDECPGATRCPLGQPCFAEGARARAAAADVIVVNMHLYGLDVAARRRDPARARRGRRRRGALSSRTS